MIVLAGNLNGNIRNGKVEMKGEKWKWKTAKHSHRLNKNVTEKNAGRKKLKYWKKNKRKTHYDRLLHTPRRQRWWWQALVPLIDCERAASTANWKTEKNAVIKNWSCGETLKTSGKLTINAFSMQLIGRDGGEGACSLDWLREGGLHGQQDSN
jgi:hypothetical protein